MSRRKAPRVTPSLNGAQPGADTLSERLRRLPSVEEIRRELTVKLAESEAPLAPSSALTAVGRDAIAHARDAIHSGAETPSTEAILADAIALLNGRARPRLRPVINAGGALLNTNLGRAPLSQRAIQRIVEIAGGYSNLEFDLESGERGSRQTHTRELLRELTGAEDAIAVNNNAAATLLALSALAAGREVIVSRGELVEIGGGFRVPDILAQSGARLVEVGTTNRVRLADYANAITPETSMILSVHPSNFRITGFTHAPTLAAIAALAHERELLLVRDLGSGALLDTSVWGMAREDTVHDSVRAGADVICFSGDKLLGGPQAGIIVGKRALLERIERHPLMRAVRCDKLTLAALEATLREYQDGTAARELPLWAAISTPTETLVSRARQWAQELRAEGISVEVIAGETAIGGGSLPGETLPTALCAIPAKEGIGSINVESFAWRLRTGEPAVLPRISRDQALFDTRTVTPKLDKELIAAIVHAWRSSQSDSTAQPATGG